MELNQQIFRAPSIPKFGKQTIASSVIRGAIKPQIKLKKSVFSFIKPIQKTVDVNKITGSVEESKKNFIIDKSLSIANNILVGIKKQLDFDYLSRIASEKNELENQRKRIAAQKVADKESNLEKDSKGILGKTFDKVTAPFKSIFQKLIDFFSIILTGILLNTAFKWLSDKNNQKKLAEFFGFLKEYWQELLIVFGIYKLIKLVSKIFGIASKLRQLIRFFGKPPGGKMGGKGGIDCSQIIKCLKTAPEFANEVIRQLITRGILANAILGMMPKPTGVPGLPPQPQQQPLFPPILGPNGTPLPLPPTVPRTPTSRPPIIRPPVTPTPTPIQTPIPQSRPSNPSATAAIWATLAAAGLTTVEIIKFLAGMGLGGAARAAEGGTIGELPEKKCTACSMGFSQGGTIPGFSGGGTVGGLFGTTGTTGMSGIIDKIGSSFAKGKDKILALLSEGEEVIRTRSAMLFRPLLKDINDNAGKRWAEFSAAVVKQSTNNIIQSELNRQFKNLIVNFKDLIDGEIKEKRKKKPKPPGGGGGYGRGGANIVKARAENPRMSPRGNEFTHGNQTTTRPSLSQSLQEARQRLIDKMALRNTNINNNIRPWWQNINPFIDKRYWVPSHDPGARNYNMPGYNRNKWFELNRFRTSPEEYKPTPNSGNPRFRYAPGSSYVKPGSDSSLLTLNSKPKVTVINLPTKTVNLGPKPGSVKTPSSGSATEVPSISPFDTGNPYISSNRLAYGMIM